MAVEDKHMDLLSKCRGLIDCTPSQEQFGEIIEVCAGWQEHPDYQAAIEYLDAHLESWPWDTRYYCIPDDLPSYLTGTVPLYFQLVRSLLVSFEWGEGEEELRQKVESLDFW